MFVSCVFGCGVLVNVNFFKCSNTMHVLLIGVTVCPNNYQKVKTDINLINGELFDQFNEAFEQDCTL